MQRLLKEQLDVHEVARIRNPSSALLGIDSSNRFQSLSKQAQSYGNGVNASPYDFNLYAPTNFIQGFFTRVAVTEVQFPWGIPNINEFSNQILFNYSPTGLAINQVTVPVQLTPGFYDYAQLAATIESAINTAIAGNHITVTYSDPAAEYLFTVASDVVTSRLWFSPVYLTGYENQKGLFEMMNWNLPTTPYAATGPRATYQSYSGVPTLLFSKYVDIVCNNLTAVQDVKDGSSSNRPRDALCRVYLMDGANPQDILIGSAPFNIYRTYNFPKQIKWEQSLPIASLSFQVYNDCGYILAATTASSDYQEGGPASSVYPYEMPDWQLTLLVSEQ